MSRLALAGRVSALRAISLIITVFSFSTSLIYLEEYVEHGPRCKSSRAGLELDLTEIAGYLGPIGH